MATDGKRKGYRKVNGTQEGLQQLANAAMTYGLAPITKDRDAQAKLLESARAFALGALGTATGLDLHVSREGKRRRRQDPPDPGPKAVACDECGRVFVHKQALALHLHRTHNRPSQTRGAKRLRTRQKKGKSS